MTNSIDKHLRLKVPYIQIFKLKLYSLKGIRLIKYINKLFKGVCLSNHDIIFIQTNLKIVLFKSLRNSKRCNNGNFTSKSNSNKIKLCGGGGQHYLVLNKIPTLYFHFLGLFTISKLIKEYFPRKRLIKIYCSC